MSTSYLDELQCANDSRVIESPERMERAPKRSAPLPPHAEPKRPRREVERALGKVRGTRRGSHPPERAAGGQMQAGAGHEEADEGWTMPWQRRPDWEYLPHLGEREDPLEGGANQSTAPYEEGQSAPSVTHNSDGIASVSDPAGGDPSLDDQLPHEDGPTGTRRRGSIGAMHDNGAVDEIRGRDSPPGAINRGPSDGRARADDDPEIRGIRGHSSVPGPTADIGRSRAQQRLSAKNAHLARSLADHAERVAKRDLMGDRPLGASAAERMAALRRRISARRCAGS